MTLQEALNSAKEKSARIRRIDGGGNWLLMPWLINSWNAEDLFAEWEVEENLPTKTVTASDIHEALHILWEQWRDDNSKYKGNFSPRAEDLIKLWGLN